MKDLLQQELTGPPVTVAIAGKEYLIAYTMAAAIAYKQATGKSLFSLEESKHIGLTEDPERWLACLWAGLHQEDAQGKWAAPISLQELKRLKISQSGLAEIDARMWAAFRGDMAKPREDESPNAEAAITPEGLAAATIAGVTTAVPSPPARLSLTPPGSTPVPAAALDSAAPSS